MATTPKTRQAAHKALRTVCARLGLDRGSRGEHSQLPPIPCHCRRAPWGAASCGATDHRAQVLGQPGPLPRSRRKRGAGGHRRDLSGPRREVALTPRKPDAKRPRSRWRLGFPSHTLWVSPFSLNESGVPLPAPPSRQEPSPTGRKPDEKRPPPLRRLGFSSPTLRVMPLKA